MQTQFIVKCASANDSLQFNDFNYRLQCIQKFVVSCWQLLAFECNEKLQAIHFFPIDQPVSGEKWNGKFSSSRFSGALLLRKFLCSVWRRQKCSVMCLIRKQHNWQFTITIYFSNCFVSFLCFAMMRSKTFLFHRSDSEMKRKTFVMKQSKVFSVMTLLRGLQWLECLEE